MSTLYDDIHQASQIVQDGRTAHDVLTHGMTEMGEFFLELQIAEGKSYKEPSDDGLLGEAVDLMICFTDLHLVAGKDTSDIAARLSDALMQQTRLTPDEMKVQLVASMARAGLDLGLAQAGVNKSLITNNCIAGISLCAGLLRAHGHEFDEQTLRDVAAPKLRKWIATCNPETPSLST